MTISLASGSDRFQYKNKDQAIEGIEIYNARNYSNTNCAKVYDKVDKDYKVLEHHYDIDMERLRLNARSGYELNFGRIDHIEWNNGTCY